MKRLTAIIAVALLALASRAEIKLFTLYSGTVPTNGTVVVTNNTKISGQLLNVNMYSTPAGVTARVDTVANRGTSLGVVGKILAGWTVANTNGVIVTNNLVYLYEDYPVTSISNTNIASAVTVTIQAVVSE